MLEFNSNNLIFYERNNEMLEYLVKQNGKKEKIYKNEIFKSESEELKYIFYIAKGKTRHYMMNEFGVEKILYVLNRGWFFGEASLILNKQKTTLFSIAEEDTFIYKIDNETARELLDTSKVFRDSILEGFAHKTMMLRNEIESLVFNPVKLRVKRFFCTNANYDENSNSEWIDIESKYTHYEIGILVGSTRVTVTKTISELCDEGFLRNINNKIQINRKKYLNFINGG